MDVTEVIRRIRDSFVGSEHVYMNGSCYYFAKILQGVYPKGELWETHDHVYFFFEGKYYDIRGHVHVNETGVNAVMPVREPTRHGKFNLIREMK